VNVEVNNFQDDMTIDSTWVKSVVMHTLALKEVSTDQVIINFVDEETITGLHADFFQDPTPTDCITFPIDPSDRNDEVHHLLGEVFVCPRTALKYAKAHDLDAKKELQLYIIHGLLHLLGYDDIEEDDRLVMREQESKCLEICEVTGL